MAEDQASEKEKRTNLGRGFAALFGDGGPTSEVVEAAPVREQRPVPVESIHPNPHQPRQRFDSETLEQLAESIRENGLLQPILVRPHPSLTEAFEIIAGERRWRAAQLAQLHEVPVIVRDLSDVKTLEVALLENIQRADLTPIEEAEGYRRLMEEFSYTQADLARSLGKSRSHIANTLRLLTLPEDVRDLLNEGSLSAGHARALVGMPNASPLAKRAVAEGLSVRQIEKLANEKKAQPRKKKDSADQTGLGELPHGESAKDADTLALERDLSAQLGLEVTIRFQGGEESERGSVTIRYETLEQLDDLLQRLGRNPEGSG
jgi:ParB family chromosome partitioning protein